MSQNDKLRHPGHSLSEASVTLCLGRLRTWTPLRAWLTMMLGSTLRTGFAVMLRSTLRSGLAVMLWSALRTGFTVMLGSTLRAGIAMMLWPTLGAGFTVMLRSGFGAMAFSLHLTLEALHVLAEVITHALHVLAALLHAVVELLHALLHLWMLAHHGVRWHLWVNGHGFFFDLRFHLHVLACATEGKLHFSVFASGADECAELGDVGDALIT